MWGLRKSPFFDQSRDSFEELPHRGNPVKIPRIISRFIIRTYKSEIETHCISAVFLYKFVRIQHIPFRLAHLRSVRTHNKPAVESLNKRFSDRHQRKIEERLYKESRIEKMHRRMFAPSRIAINRHPLLHERCIGKIVGIFRIKIPKEIPRRIHKSIERVIFRCPALAKNSCYAFFQFF